MAPPPQVGRKPYLKSILVFASALFYQVNYVNAVALAKQTGLAIQVAFSERDPKGYSNGVTVEFELDGVLNGRRTMTGEGSLFFFSSLIL